MDSPVRTTLEERDEARLGGRGGFAFLFAAGCTWSLASVSTFFLPAGIAALVYLFQGVLMLPLAFSLERLLGFSPVPKGNSLFPLVIQMALVQTPALIAVIIVYSLDPAYVPAALAAIVGGHFLPYIWLMDSKLYGMLGAFVAVVPYLMMGILGGVAFHYIGFVVGVTLLVSAFLLKTQVDKELAELSKSG